MNELLATLLRLGAVLLLVALNGFFVATEFALVSVRSTRIEELVAAGRPGAARVQRALGNLDRFIAATQLGITMASLGLGSLGEPAVAGLLHGALAWLPAALEPGVVAGALAFVIITSLHIVFGELAPKTIALRLPERTALLVVAPTSLFLQLFRPAIVLLNGSGALAVRLVGLQPASGHEGGLHSPEEIELLVEQSARGGAIADSERRMLRGVFDVGDRLARQAMTPRTLVRGIALGSSLPEAIAAALVARHSRLPVYDGDLDHVAGMLHLRDLLQAREQERLGRPPPPLQRLLRAIPAVPESVTLDEVLDALRAARSHMAVVVDEYGGTAGIITLEDILEEIVGEVRDEFDLPGPAELAREPDGSWLLDGQLTLDEVDEQVGTHLAGTPGDARETPEVDTLGGLILWRLGRLAAEGDEVRADPDASVLLRVERLDGRRVARVRLTRLPEVASAADHTGAAGPDLA